MPFSQTAVSKFQSARLTLAGSGPDTTRLALIYLIDGLVVSFTDIMIALDGIKEKLAAQQQITSGSTPLRR